MMLRTVEAMTAGVLFVIGQALPPDTSIVGPISNMSAVGILGWICYQQLAELREHRRERQSVIKEIYDRQHDDSEHLNETLRTMTAQCAATQASLKK
jgi:hypothetical protein